jgi:DNA polymerase I-like protein with 3'-5' exonuclease and polymerase domains
MRVLAIAASYETKYYAFAKNALAGHSVFIPVNHFPLMRSYMHIVKANSVEVIALSDPKLIERLVNEVLGKYGKFSHLDWAGTVIEYMGVKVVFQRPLQHLLTVPFASHLYKRYLLKVTSPRFPRAPQLNYIKLNESNVETYYKMFKSAKYIAVDIETIRQQVDIEKISNARARGEPVDGLAAYMQLQTGSKKEGWCIPMIDMCGWCGLFLDEKGCLYSVSVVLPITNMHEINWMRKFNSLPAPKITQNGGYEATYFIGRYNAPLYNWTCDTFHFMHSWYAELPRTLDFIAGYFLANHQYWKDESGSNRFEYNAKDTHTTLWSWVYMIAESPQWAKDNYLIEFRKVFPNITTALEGMRVDEAEQTLLRDKFNKQTADAETSLTAILWDGFNPRSSQQCKAVMSAFSVVAPTSSDAKAMQKFGESHPFHTYLVELITAARAGTKKVSTFIDAYTFDGRMLYETNCGGTDTGRASSKGSNLWVGTNIQNQDNELRSMYVADTIANGAAEDWILANCDGSQAESRCTAYISEDAQLMDSVENAPDFHTRNASLFFGIPEDEIVTLVWETITIDGVEIQQPVLDKYGKQVKDKSIRSLSKRVNHGANYNMGAWVLLETMGSKNVNSARKLLGLSPRWSLMTITQHLLNSFDKTYPDIRGKYYEEVIEEIKITHRLYLPNGWTRYCFEVPSRSRKLALNKYVAHKPQSLSVMLVDDAMFDFWLEYQIKQEKVRLKAQVHDEIIYQVRGTINYDTGKPVSEHYAETSKALSDLMARPIEVNGRTMVIPNDGGGAGYRWSDIKD